MRASRLIALSFAALGGCTVTAVPVQNPQPGPTVVVAERPAGAHPAYLHALSDLRDARAHLEKPAGAMVKWDENNAIREIDAAINEIKRASVDDGKNINDHVAIDVALAWDGRLHKSLELIERARADINQEEDNGWATGLRNRAMGHIDGAARFIHEGIDVQAHSGPAVVVVAPPPPPPPVVVNEGKHPAYLHALSDLRVARAHLRKPGNAQVKWDERKAVKEIDDAIREIKVAAIEDGKNVDENPPIDEHLPWGNRLQKALELVRKAHADINEEEDNPQSRGLKNRANGHIDAAERFINEGIANAGPPPAPVNVENQGNVQPGAHPAYLHALTDLRDARAHLEKPAKPEVKWDENTSIREIDAAIKEIKDAAIDDGKNLNDHPGVDTHLGHKARLRKALELLEGAARDVREREDNNFARGLKERAAHHIDEAAHFVKQAIENAK